MGLPRRAPDFSITSALWRHGTCQALPLGCPGGLVVLTSCVLVATMISTYVFLHVCLCLLLPILVI